MVELANRWLDPDESVLWTGAPGRAGGGVLLLGASATWLAMLWVLIVWASVGGWIILILCLGLCAVLVQSVATFVVRRRRERRSTYAVTTKRAVVARDGRVAAEAPLTSATLVRRWPDRMHGTLLFLSADAAEADPATTIYDVEVPWPFGVHPGGERTLLAFHGIDRLDALVTALRHAGVEPVESIAPRRGAVAAVFLGLPSVASRGSVNSARRGRRGPARWLRSRLGRRDVRVESPLSPEVARQRLAVAIPTPRGRLSSLRSGYAGRLQGWHVSAWNRTMGQRNTVWRFEGNLCSGPGECSTLVGRVGPNPLFPIFVSVWVTVVLLILVGGSIGCIVSVSRGTPAPWPAVFVPAAMLVPFVIVVETAYRTGAAGWDRLEQHLRAALEARGPVDAAPAP
jgi:hypothetical protein